MAEKLVEQMTNEELVGRFEEQVIYENQSSPLRIVSAESARRFMEEHQTLQKIRSEILRRLSLHKEESTPTPEKQAMVESIGDNPGQGL